LGHATSIRDGRLRVRDGKWGDIGQKIIRAQSFSYTGGRFLRDTVQHNARQCIAYFNINKTIDFK
jgi:hypothetical protein